jgi:hypothetical protein
VNISSTPVLKICLYGGVRGIENPYLPVQISEAKFINREKDASENAKI